MTKIKPYLSLRKLFSVVVVVVFFFCFVFFFFCFFCTCYSFFCYVCLFSGRNYKDDDVFFSGSHLGLTFNQFIIYLNLSNIYLYRTINV